MAAAATPYLAQSQFLGNQGVAGLQLGDYLTNQQQMLQGETAREQEGLGLGNLLARLGESQITNRNGMLSPLLNLLSGQV